jgi:hypothetical protein
VHGNENAEEDQQSCAHGVAGNHGQPPVEPVREGPGGQLQADQRDLPCCSHHACEYRRVGQRED